MSVIIQNHSWTHSNWIKSIQSVLIFSSWNQNCWRFLMVSEFIEFDCIIESKLGFGRAPRFLCRINLCHLAFFEMYWIEARSSGWLKMVEMYSFGASCPPFHPRRDSTKTCSGRRGLFVINIEQVHVERLIRWFMFYVLLLVSESKNLLWQGRKSDKEAAVALSREVRLACDSIWITSQRDCFEHFLNSWSYKSCPALARCP